MIDDQELVHRLLDAGLADKQTLRKGIELGKDSGLSLYEALILNRLISQRKTVRLLSQLLAVPSVRLEAVDPSSRVIALVPSSMAKRNRAIPLGLREKDGKRSLIVAMYDPTDVLAVGEVSTHTGYDVRPVLIGPRDLADALESYYGVSQNSMDDIFGDLGSLDFEVGQPDEEWASFFDKSDDVGAESSDISLEMRDRPSTDVLDIPEEEVEAVLAEGDDPLEAFEIPQTGKINQIANLEEYEVDDAITGNRDSGSFAQILSANDAEALFGASPPPSLPKDSSGAAVGEHVRGSGPYDAAQLVEESDAGAEEEEGEPTGGTAVGVSFDDLAEIPDSSDDEEVGDEPSSRTEVGRGFSVDDSSPDDETNDLESGGDDDTGQTAFGVGPSAEKDSGAGGAVLHDRPKNGRLPGTDYRALGAAILKEESEVEEAKEGETASTEAQEKALEDARTDIHEPTDDTTPKSKSPPEDPVTREIEEDDLRLLAEDEDEATNIRTTAKRKAVNPFAVDEKTAVHHRAAGRATAARGFSIPDDIPSRHVVEAMAEVLFELGFTNAEALLERARTLAAESD